MPTISERLRDEGMRLSGRSLDRGCADSGIASNLADEAADVIDKLTAALEKAESHIVTMYRGINPHANYDDEPTFRGTVSGNRYADQDEVVKDLRAALSLVRQEEKG